MNEQYPIKEVDQNKTESVLKRQLLIGSLLEILYKQGIDTNQNNLLGWLVSGKRLLLCGVCSESKVARELSQATGRKIKSRRSERDDRFKTHMYLEDMGSGEIIDPTAGYFFDVVPDKYKYFFIGSIFIGTRDDLKKVYMDSEVQLPRIRDLDANRPENFEKIWGDIGSDYEQTKYIKTALVEK